MVNATQHMALEDRICETFVVLSRVAGLSSFSSRLEISREEYLKSGQRLDHDYVRVRIPDLVEKEYVPSLIKQQLPKEGAITVVDIGCFRGDFFTADMAQYLGNRDMAFGLDRFKPEDFNRDEKEIRQGNHFSSQKEVLDYVHRIHPERNLHFYPHNFSRGSSFSQYHKGKDGLIVTGFRIPDIVSCQVIDSAVQADASLLALVPVGTCRMEPTEPEFAPRSAYMKQPELALNKRQLHRLVNLDYSMVRNHRPHRADQKFIPSNAEQRFDYQVNMLAKQLVMLDRARHLKEHGYDATVARYEDGFGWGTTGHHHILMAKKHE
ncbi:hypothetical protein HY488_00325 [Candidatus Woesearchaeota archaeon]|nr:hypothetical protein [Candidatus Woesearchaeota archaeon]